MTIDSDRSAEEIAADFNRSEEELTAEFKRRFDDGLTPEQRARQHGIEEGWELRDKEIREAQQKHRSGKDKRPKIVKASQIKPERQTWFYKIDGEGVMPLKVCTMFGGIGGDGKSTKAIHVASLLSRGELEGDLYGQKHPTIMFGPEDDWPTVHVPRFTAAGADLDLIYQLTAEVTEDNFTGERDLKFPLDTELLEEAIIETSAKLVVIDPISAAMQEDINKSQDVRRAVGGLDALAKKHDIAVIIINHFKKGGSSAAEKASGSHSFRDIVRAYLAFATDDESSERIITQDKNNYGTGYGSWKFVLEGVHVQTDEGPTEAPVVKMLGASDVTVNDLIDREHSDHDDDRNAAEVFILDFLKQCDGWEAKAGDVIKAGRAEGFTENQIKNARKRCKNPRIKSGSPVVGAGWIWSIQEDPPTQGVTKDPKESQGVKESRMTPTDTLPNDPVKESQEVMCSETDTLDTLDTLEAPSPDRGVCPEHGTNYHVSTCTTCLQLAKETI